jgi:FKBP-type peptidyl-prolyl cis-trans isomerase 2
MGMHAGDEKKVVVKPEDAYGPVVPNAQTEVPKDAVPKEGLKVGTALMARSGSGETRPVVVKEIKESTVVLDLNHPLAGKTLFFDVKVLGVQPPAPAPAPAPTK